MIQLFASVTYICLFKYIFFLYIQGYVTDDTQQNISEKTINKDVNTDFKLF